MAAGPAVETLEGTLERIVFRAEASSFVVARLRREGTDVVTVVGTLAGVTPATPVRLHGRWEQDRRYGAQFRVETYQVLTPETVAGIERYLGSGAVPGLGPELARRIVARFGHETLEILQHTPDRLVEVEGIGPVRAARIRERLEAQREVQDVMVFLQGHGVSPAFAARIHKRYGAATIAIVRENPYRLALEIWGIGFRSADAIASRLGIAKDSPARAEAGLLHVLGELTEDGHVHAPEHELLRAAREALVVDDAILEPAIGRLVAAGRLVREDLGDRGPCLSLRALWEAETRAAASLAAIVATPMPALELDVDAALASFERERGITLAAQQRAAVRAAVRDKVVVITGGPGVGKTTIVNAILRLCDLRARRVLLGAPTGRAAKRLAETTGRPAATIHRLLEYAPQAGGFGRNAGTPLDAHVVIVDEASMLDTSLASALLDAMPASSQLVLVGDVDQLPSVGPGRVLADVIASRAATVVRLTEIFRQAASSAIVVNAHRVNRGDLPDLAARESSDFYFVARDTPADALATIVELVAERIPRRFGLDPVADVQVLAPMHRGEIGAQNLNAALQARLNPPAPSAAELVAAGRTLRVGDKVIQLRNDYDKDVFNGDVGRIAAVAAVGDARVADESSDEETGGARLVVEFDGRPVGYETGELDQLGLAYALSVHKSQGSEYPAVVVPLLTQHYMMLKRNLLYTAMTRGKRLVVLVGSRKAVGIAVRADDGRLRWTYLARRIEDALRATPARPA